MNTKIIFLIVGLQLVAVMVAISMFVFGKKICMTDKCRRLSKFLQEGIMKNVNPCEDFYSYACDASQFPMGLAITQEYINIGWFLETLREPPERDDWDVFKTMKNFCQKFTEKLPKEVRVERMKKLFQEFGGFPVVDGAGWDEATWSWQDAASRALQKGFWVYLFNIFLWINPQDPSKLVFAVNYPSVPSRRLSITQLGMVLDMFLPRSNATSKQVIEIRNFDYILQTIIVNQPIMNYTNMMKLSDVTASFGFVDWAEIIKMVSQTQDDVSGDLDILVLSPGYLRDLQILFKSLTKRLLANYMMWNNLSQLQYYLAENSDLACFLFLDDTMPIALQAMYLNKKPYSSYADSVADMALRIKRELINSVENSNWMDLKTKQEALKKVGMMKTRIGYPEEFLNRARVNERYESLFIDDDFLKTILMFKKSSMNESFNQIVSFKQTFVDILVFSSMKIYSLNAFYFIPDNSINLLHAILMPPFYDREWPSYVKYGMMGSFVGHEFTHGLDTKGCHYDGSGRLRDWWDNQTFSEFENKAQCFIDQYNKFLFFNESLPGALEVGENIADSGGVELAFKAYQRLPKGWFGYEPTLCDLELTPEQTFFLSFAKFHCRRYRPEDVRRELASEHAPNSARIVGSLQNSHHFSDAFGCGSGTTMNPKLKCKLW